MPNEGVSFLDADGNKERLVVIPNTHFEPTHNFEISPENWLSVSPLSLVHSHVTTSAKPSRTDVIMCEESGIPWHIYSLKDNAWEVLMPQGIKFQLAGREFIWGVHDCFSLVRDYYKTAHNIDLPNFYRRHEFWRFGEDLIARHYEGAGFSKVDDLKVGDLVVMKIFSKIPNHLGVFVQNRLLLHHISRRLSGVDIYGGVWLQNNCAVYRHKTLL